MDEQASGDSPRAAGGQRRRPGAVGRPCDSNSGSALSDVEAFRNYFDEAAPLGQMILPT